MSILSRLKGGDNLNLLPMGTKVSIVGGTYKHQTALVVGHTAKMYSIQLEGGQRTSVRQHNVQPLPRESSVEVVTNLTDKEKYGKLIEAEVRKVNQSLQLITIYLEKLDIYED